jgi:hypothetical protein
MTSLFTQSDYAYVGPAILSRLLADSTVRRFRGRVVRHEISGELRFSVNRTPSRRIPKGWPTAEDYTDDFDMRAVEWLGKRPDDPKSATRRRLRRQR